MHNLPHEEYRDYSSAISRCCDIAMQLDHPTWRHPTYVLTLEALLLTSWDIDQTLQTQSDHVARWPGSDVVAEIRRSQNVDCYPISTNLPKVEEESTSASSATHSASSHWSSQSEDYETAHTSPATVRSDVSLAPSPPVSPNRDYGTLRCDLGDPCDAIFTGDSSATNLKRHKKYATIHHKPSQRCPIPGCDKKVSRPDNLGTHLQVVHSLIKLPPERKTRRRRESRAKSRDQNSLPKDF